MNPAGQDSTIDVVVVEDWLDDTRPGRPPIPHAAGTRLTLHAPAYRRLRVGRCENIAREFARASLYGREYWHATTCGGRLVRPDWKPERVNVPPRRYAPPEPEPVPERVRIVLPVPPRVVRPCRCGGQPLP